MVRALTRLFLVVAVAAHDKRRAREFRQVLPKRAPIVGPAVRDDRFDPLVEGSRPRCVIAAKTDAPNPNAAAIDVVSCLEPINDGSDNVFIIGADRKIILGLAL